MTGQTILNIMEVLDAELQLQPGEADVTKGLVALNVAQDVFESVVARYPGALGSSTGTVATAQGVETTAFPTGLLRLDGLDMLSSTSPNLPVWPLSNLHATGAHAYTGTGFFQFLLYSTVQGGPQGYWTNGTSIYWDPLPDQAYTLRWYGFAAAADITASGTFVYPDIVALPIGTIATRLIRTGLDDAPSDLTTLGDSVIQPVLKALDGFNRDGAAPLRYRYWHET